MIKKIATLGLSAILVSAASAPAFAHIGAGDHGGFAHGFLHPMNGLDHMAAMVAIGMLAAQLGGRALWLVPSAFLGMMVGGGMFGFAGFQLPLVEFGIGLSVIILGVLVALGAKLPTVLAMAIAGIFAIFHGHAHGAELPQGIAPATYAMGFVIATGLLHAAGIALGMGLQRFAQTSRIWTTRIAGAVMAVFGVSLFAQ